MAWKSLRKPGWEEPAEERQYVLSQAEKEQVQDEIAAQEREHLKRIFGANVAQLEEEWAKINAERAERKMGHDWAGICICGHRQTAHASEGLTPSARLRAEHPHMMPCKTNRMECQCEQYRPVVETTNTRVFCYKSTGHGIRHALFQGMMKAKSLGSGIRWADGVKCDWCATGDGRAIFPIMLTVSGEEMDHPIRGLTRDFLICDEHRAMLQRRVKLDTASSIV